MGKKSTSEGTKIALIWTLEGRRCIIFSCRGRPWENWRRTVKPKERGKPCTCAKNQEERRGRTQALFPSQGKGHDGNEEYFYTLLDGVVVHHMVVPINYFHLYTLVKGTVRSKCLAQCPRPGPEPGPLVQVPVL